MTLSTTAKRAIAGVAIVVGLVAVVGVLLRTSGHTEVTVRNDTKSWVRIAGCVDDAADINTGESFTAEGVPDQGRLFCLVTPNAEGSSRCVALPPKTERTPEALSKLPVVASSRC